MDILIGGSSGLIGRRLVAELEGRGHIVRRLIRPQSQPGAPSRKGDIPWNPEADDLDPESLAGLDAVVNLGGENIAGGYWSAARKHRIRTSRVRATSLLSRAIAASTRPPRVFLSASAIGLYGDRGAEPLDETAARGSGFLAGVCVDWEGASRLPSNCTTRLINLRIGIVLTRQGGALAKMLPLFRLGLGGPIGSGNQFMSWVSIEDVVRAACFCLESKTLRGPVNLTAPYPVTNRVLTRTLGKALGRPAFLPFPAMAAKLLLGDMGRELLLAGANVIPAALLQAGFQFEHEHLTTALDAALKEKIGT